jgi:hypothetical protein
VGFPQVAREGGIDFSVGDQDMQFALEGIGGFGVVGRLDLGDEAVEAGAQGGIGDVVLLAEGFERAGTEGEAAEELEIFLVEGFEPGWEGLLHKMNMHLQFVKVKQNAVYVE